MSLTGQSIIATSDDQGEEWWFFCEQMETRRGVQRTIQSGLGFWKKTGEDGKIMARGSNRVIGTKKNVVFREGRSPGIKTNWVIHEYHAHTTELDDFITVSIFNLSIFSFFQIQFLIIIIYDFVENHCYSGSVSA